MTDSHTRMYIFEIFDYYDSGSDEDFQASDPDQSESSEGSGCKEHGLL